MVSKKKIKINKYCHIIVHSDVRDKLAKLKKHPKQSFNDIIRDSVNKKYKTNIKNPESECLKRQKKRNPKEWRLIPVKRNTGFNINSIKIVPRETYNDALNRVVNFYKEHKGRKK